MLSRVDWSKVDSCEDCPWTVMANPEGSIPRVKKVSLVAPRILPDESTAEKAPVVLVDVKLPDARRRPGTGGLTSTYA